MDPEGARAAVHEALRDYLKDGELAVAWVLTIEVVGCHGVRYLAHRSGGGMEGHDHPSVWQAAGMLQASADVARKQMTDALGDA